MPNSKEMAQQLRDLGGNFADAADKYNVQLKAQASTMTMNEIFPLIQQELSLRQAANRLFFEAGQLEIEGAEEDIAKLNTAVADANLVLARLEELRAVLDLVADLLVLGTAVLAGKPGPIIAALKEIKKDVEEAPPVG
jgi:hypothetical protein